LSILNIDLTKRPGLVLMYIALGILSSIVYHLLLKAENARRDRGERDEIIGDESGEGKNEKNGRFATVDDAKREKGDQWSGYRYATWVGRIFDDGAEAQPAWLVKIEV
jgi:hypothetical protein